MQTLLLYMALGGMAAAGPAVPAEVPGQGQGMRQQLVIMLEDLPDAAPAEVRQQRLDQLGREAGLPAGAVLQWLRPLAVGGEVVRVTGVTPDQLDALVQALARQPGVRWVQVDGRVGIGPGPRLPRVEIKER